MFNTEFERLRYNSVAHYPSEMHRTTSVSRQLTQNTHNGSNKLQKLLHIVEIELFELDMSLNTKKSVCIRFGPRYQSPCCSLKSIKGDDIL